MRSNLINAKNFMVIYNKLNIISKFFMWPFNIYNNSLSVLLSFSMDLKN